MSATRFLIFRARLPALVVAPVADTVASDERDANLAFD